MVVWTSPTFARISLEVAVRTNDDAEPGLDLVDPRRSDRGEVEMHVRVGLQPMSPRPAWYGWIGCGQFRDRALRTWLYTTAAATTRTPWKRYCHCWARSRKTVALSTCTISPAPRRVPRKVPRPPSRLVPPRTTAVMLLRV